MVRTVNSGVVHRRYRSPVAGFRSGWSRYRGYRARRKGKMSCMESCLSDIKSAIGTCICIVIICICAPFVFILFGIIAFAGMGSRPKAIAKYNTFITGTWEPTRASFVSKVAEGSGIAQVDYKLSTGNWVGDSPCSVVDTSVSMANLADETDKVKPLDYQKYHLTHGGRSYSSVSWSTNTELSIILTLGSTRGTESSYKPMQARLNINDCECVNLCDKCENEDGYLEDCNCRRVCQDCDYYEKCKKASCTLGTISTASITCRCDSWDSVKEGRSGVITPPTSAGTINTGELTFKSTDDPDLNNDVPNSVTGSFGMTDEALASAGIFWMVLGFGMGGTEICCCCICIAAVVAACALCATGIEGLLGKVFGKDAEKQGEAAMGGGQPAQQGGMGQGGMGGGMGGGMNQGMGGGMGQGGMGGGMGGGMNQGMGGGMGQGGMGGGMGGGMNQGGMGMGMNQM